jgi:hypothetical protein
MAKTSNFSLRSMRPSLGRDRVTLPSSLNNEMTGFIARLHGLDSAVTGGRESLFNRVTEDPWSPSDMFWCQEPGGPAGSEMPGSIAGRECVRLIPSMLSQSELPRGFAPAVFPLTSPRAMSSTEIAETPRRPHSPCYGPHFQPVSTPSMTQLSRRSTDGPEGFALSNCQGQSCYPCAPRRRRKRSPDTSTIALQHGSVRLPRFGLGLATSVPGAPLLSPHTTSSNSAITPSITSPFMHRASLLSEPPTGRQRALGAACVTASNSPTVRPGLHITHPRQQLPHALILPLPLLFERRNYRIGFEVGSGIYQHTGDKVMSAPYPLQRHFTSPFTCNSRFGQSLTSPLPSPTIGPTMSAPPQDFKDGSSTSPASR